MSQDTKSAIHSTISHELDEYETIIIPKPVKKNNTMICPSCYHPAHLGKEIGECDNDCGTFYCIKCDCEYYQEEGIIKKGHKENCGNDSDDNIDCSAEIQPRTD